MIAGLSAQEITVYNVYIYFSSTLHEYCNLSNYAFIPKSNYMSTQPIPHKFMLPVFALISLTHELHSRFGNLCPTRGRALS